MLTAVRTGRMAEFICSIVFNERDQRYAHRCVLSDLYLNPEFDYASKHPIDSDKVLRIMRDPGIGTTPTRRCKVTEVNV